MHTVDIQGLSVEEIARNYAMPTPTNMICYVEVRNNTPFFVIIH